jgi:hypothetical protein
MELNLIVESKNFNDDTDMKQQLEKNPCKLCLFGQGMMCVERSKCRWDTHKEIFIKKEVREIKAEQAIKKALK